MFKNLVGGNEEGGAGFFSVGAWARVTEQEAMGTS